MGPSLAVVRGAEYTRRRENAVGILIGPTSLGRSVERGKRASRDAAFTIRHSAYDHCVATHANVSAAVCNRWWVLLGWALGGCTPSAPAPATIAQAPPTQAAATASLPTPPAPRADFGAHGPSQSTRFAADRIVATADNGGLPFLIVDKVAAEVLAFASDGRLVAHAPALLGLTRGDDSVAGIGQRRIADIRPEERTTPAGRFAAEMGENAQGAEILWVDYDSAISLHPVRVVAASQRRLQRLASPTPEDNRISYGCINVPPQFFADIVRPLFAPRDGIVYVLPETRAIDTLFDKKIARPTP